VAHTQPDTTAPHAVELEAAVLGGMMIDAGAVRTVLGILRTEDFHKPEHRTIFRAIESLHDKGSTVDVQTVKAQLELSGALGKVGGTTGLIELADSVLSSASARDHALIIKEKSALRQVIDFGMRLTRACNNGVGDLNEVFSNAKKHLTAIEQRYTLSGERKAVAITMDKVDPKEIDWLWPGWLPKGKITLIEGDGSMGKSTLTLQIAAIVSRGWPFPDSLGRPGQPRPPAGVILMAGEDGLADTVRPRLDRAGADVSKVMAVTKIQDLFGKEPGEKRITLEDIAELEELIREKDVALLVVDPLQAYLGSRVDMNATNEVRPICDEFAAMLERTNCVGLIIRHFRKAEGSPSQRGGGSVDFYNVARGVINVGVDPDDEDPRNPSKYIMALAKHNITKRPESLLYTLSDGFKWAGVSEYTAHEIVRYEASKRVSGAFTGRSRTEEAKEIILEALGGVPLNSAHLKDILYKAGLNDATIDRAKKDLGVISKKIGGVWCMGRPADFEGWDRED
jgi:DNA repair protein RadA/Sms